MNYTKHYISNEKPYVPTFYPIVNNMADTPRYIDAATKAAFDEFLRISQEILDEEKKALDEYLLKTSSLNPLAMNLMSKRMVEDFVSEAPLGSAYYKKTLFDEYVNSLMQQPIDQYRPAGYVRAPKFGVKHKINL